MSAPMAGRGLRSLRRSMRSGMSARGSNYPHRVAAVSLSHPSTLSSSSSSSQQYSTASSATSRGGLTTTSLHRRPTLPRTTPTTTTPTTVPKRTLFIQTEPTPNPDALKFLPGSTILPPDCPSLEYLSGRTSHSSPLARKLFALDTITSVFFGPDFITVTKSPNPPQPTPWSILKPEIFSLITEHLNSHRYVVDETLLAAEKASGTSENFTFLGSSDTAPSDDDSDVVAMIKELLDTRIRPAIQEDGGDIEFRGFDEATGKVLLKLRGACRTCDSSTVTLKNGIESMLMHYVEEVKEVEQVLDQEEVVAVREFERFEESLRKAKEKEQEKVKEKEATPAPGDGLV